MSKTMRGLLMSLVLVSLVGCKQEKPLPTEVVLLSSPGGALSELETALRQEISFRSELLSMLRAPAQAVGEVATGDPAARDALIEEISELSAQLDAKMALEDEKLTEPMSVLTAAEEALAEAKEELESAQDSFASYSGRFLVAPEKKRCGDDGCGGDCGACDWNEVCINRYCRCLPSCEGKECGDDGCGGICGTGECGRASYCSESRQCLSLPTETECRKSCRGIPEGRVTVTKSAKDYGFTPRRNYDPWRVGSLSELEDYRRTLESRKTELDGHISGAASLSQTRAEVQTKVDAANATLEGLLTDLKSLQKDLGEGKKAARKAKDDAKVAADARVAELQTAVTDKATHISVVRTDLKELASRLKDLDAQIKRLDKEQPDIVVGRDKVVAEIARAGGAIATWRNLEAQVTTKQTNVASAQAAVDRARQALTAVSEAVAAAKAELSTQAAPALNAKKEELAKLLTPAFPNPVGTAAPDGLNMESPRFLQILDNARLPDLQARVSAILEQRSAAYSALDDEKKALYPDWPGEMDLLRKYLLFLEALSQSTQRQVALESRLTDLRKTLLQAE